ncbi:MAG: ankyrin repeat domain-containing protein [Holosporaceae bacterium]|nr:ankyrin repeat domain-containing protein [Holosporaceae bacterium]
MIVFFQYSPQSCAMTDMNVVMATDSGYVVPTSVAMHSVVKNCQKSCLFFVIFVTRDVIESPARALLESFRVEGKIDVCLVDVSSIEQIGDLNASFEKAKAVIPGNKLIAIRMLFPKIFGTKSLPEFNRNEKLRTMKHFLWLDSDLIVVKDLSPWYLHLLTNSRSRQQPIISANLMFIEMQPELPYQEEIQRTYKFWGNDRGFNPQNFVASGGVLFWNLEIVPKFRHIVDAHTQPPASITLMQRVDTLLSLKHGTYDMPLFSTEEQVFGELLPDQACFFPTTFNCRSAYLHIANDLLIGLNASAEDAQFLREIASGEVSIWHWDYEKKPWAYCPTTDLAVPERTWWNYFDEFFGSHEGYDRELMRFFASVGNSTMVQKYIKQCHDDCRDVAIRHGHIGLASMLQIQEKVVVARYMELYRSEIRSGNPLCFALSKGHFEMVRHLKTSENVNQQDNTGTRTPLLLAIEKYHLPTVQYLLEHGADIRSSCLRGVTPIHLASKIGYLPVMQYLICKGANVNECIGRDTTPLRLATSLPIVQCLVAYDAKITNADDYSSDIKQFFLSMRKFKLDIFSAIKGGDLDYVRYLVAYKGVNPNMSDGQGNTPLMRACQCGHFGMVRYLVEGCNASITASSSTGVTSLHYAAAGGNLDVVKYLVEKGAEVTKTSTGNKPLHNAALYGHFSVVKYFVEEHCADINEKGKGDKTPLEMVDPKKHPSVAQYLSERLIKKP